MTRRLFRCLCLSILAVLIPSVVGSAASPPPVTEFTAGLTQGGRPTSITAGPDGAMWFTEPGDPFIAPRQPPRIGRINPSGAITEFPVPHIPAQIAAGPDGNLWYTVRGGMIGRLTPSGAVTEFTDGITVGSLSGITAGPDGNLWFSEKAGKTIGRITPQGTVTEFTVNPSASDADYPGTGITAGPDGNLWFAQYFPRQIGRITPQGAVTLFPADPNGPGLFNAPVDITAGPDGNLWFTERDRIGRISTSGALTEFDQGITASGSGMGEITTGPDGNVWFAEYGAGRIGRILPSGEVTEFPPGPTTASSPWGIAAGPDGNIWFAGQPSLQAIAVARITGTPLLSGDLIGRFAPPPPDPLTARATLRTRRVGARLRVVSLRVTGLVPGTRLELRCLRGCKVRRNVQITSQASWDFTRLFRSRLAPRASISVKITKPGWLGRSFTWTTRGRRLVRTTCQVSLAGKQVRCRRN